MASAALEDFAKRPPTYKAAVFLGVAGLLGALYYQFGFRKTRAELDDALAKSQNLKQTAAALINDKKEYDSLIKELDELQRQKNENTKALPTEAELPAFFETLSRKVGEAGVEVRKWDYGKEVAIEGFLKVPVQIELTGSFPQLKRFFASLVQRNVVANDETSSAASADKERIITIEGLDLAVQAAQTEQVLLTATFTAATFRLAPKPDETNTGPGKAAAGGNKPTPGAPPAAGATTAKPPASGTAPPATPPAPATSPAGAKGKVDQSMEKSETRSAGSPAKEGASQ